MLIDELKAIVGPEGWLDDPAEMVAYTTEWRDRYVGRPLLFVAPSSTADVAAIVQACAREKVAIVPQGGNTGLCGGAIPDASGTQVILSLRRMRSIRAVQPNDFSIVVDAGCTLLEVQQAAVNVNRFFPLSLSAEGTCQIGGNLSTNAGGINVLRYGTARSQVLGLEVVLPDGRVLNGLRSLQKDTAGYDLKQVFIGAEGTLGIITGACLKLQPSPGPIHDALVSLTAPSVAVELLANLRSQIGNSILAFELMSKRAIAFVLQHIPDARFPHEEPAEWHVLISSNADSGAFEEALSAMLKVGLIQDAAIAKNQKESEALWRIRHSISEAQKFEGVSLKHDVSVPVAMVGKFVEKTERAVTGSIPGARIVAFGHVGDGNIHFNVSQPPSQDGEDFAALRERVAVIVYDIVAALGGSFSAEHGIGQARRAHLQKYRSPEEIATMRAIKNALDPHGIMNPGKVL